MTDSSDNNGNVISIGPKRAARGGKAGASKASGRSPAPPRDPNSEPPNSDHLARTREKKNDLGAARRLVKTTGGDLLFCPDKSWGRWDGTRFSFEDGEAAARRAAYDLHDRVWSEELVALRAAGPGPTESLEDFEKRVKSYSAFAQSLGNAGKCSAVLEQASAMTDFYIPLRELDPTEAISCGNGTIFLDPTAKGADVVRFEAAWDRGHRITRHAPAHYVVGAAAPHWYAFLEKMLPDPEERAYFQRIIGFCLTLGNQEQVFFLFQGLGGDGKSTAMNAIAAALGDLVGDAQVQTFLAQDRKGSEASPDIASLAGATRIVRVSEPPAGASLDEGAIKQYSGGEPITARNLFKGLFSFAFQAKIIMSCNVMPKIKGDDKGIWRRIKVLNWRVSLDKKDQDNKLGKVLESERDGVLQWALNGYEMWLEAGLNEPLTAKASVDDYRATSSPYMEWFESACVLDKAAKSLSAELKRAYDEWAEKNGHNEATSQALARFWQARQLQSCKSGGIKYWRGVRLRTQAEMVEYERELAERMG